ncbi:hypothetical protein E2C01_014961 [Portunus trituberculatus]|uniref:Uncharacterized protein n=1 Tax=Portunus trituberculatus TaxID=210409 RepID=A0A5B7DLF6_PORTR|nr:hypothetical protein [Portunus trituberculatus]
MQIDIHKQPRREATERLANKLSNITRVSGPPELGAQITTVSLNHCKASLWPNYYKVLSQTSDQELGSLASSARLRSIQWWQFGAVGPKS